MIEGVNLTSDQVDQIYALAKSRFPDLFDNHYTYNDSMHKLYYEVYLSIIQELAYN